MLDEDVADVNVLDLFHGGEEIASGGDGLLVDGVEGAFWDGSRIGFPEAEGELATEDFFFLIGGGVGEPVAEHESVELGFGEFERTCLLDGVLSGDDEEGCGKRVSGFSDRDLPFLHGFEEGALDFWGGAIDFVCEENVGKDGAELGGEPAGAGEKDFGTDNIRRQHVDGELNPAEAQIDGFGEGVDEEGFCQSRHAHEEDMAAGEKGDEKAFDDGVLSDHDGSDALPDGIREWKLGLGGHGVGE
jgi:hypothetical protein